MGVKILTVRDIGRHARSGRPLPYPSPLRADLCDGHIRAVRRYFRWFCASLWLAGVGGSGALLVRWLPQLLPIFLAAVVVGIVASVGLWTKGVSRHRAVLAAYGVETDNTGKPVPTPSQIAARHRRKVERLDLRTEASRALLWYWSISAVGLVTALGYAAYLAHETDPFNYRESPWWIFAAVLVGGLTELAVGMWALDVSMKRVALAGGPQDPQDRYGGCALVAVTLLCVAASLAGQADRISDEPLATVDTQVVCYETNHGRSKECLASWEYDGRTYSRRVSASLGEGPRQIEISAADPYVVLTGADIPVRRYGVWVVAPVALAGGVHWLLRSIALTRRLRRAARSTG